MSLPDESYLEAPFCFLSLPLHRLVSDKSFVLKNTSPVERDGYHLLKIDFAIDPHFFESQPRDPGKQVIGGSLIVEPEYNYTIHERTVFRRDKKPSQVKIFVRYGSIQDNIRVPSAVEAIIATTTKKVCELKDIKLGPTPDSEFTLAAFGLPEPGSSGATAKTRGMTTTYQLGLAGLVCLAAAIGFRYWGRKSARPSTGAT